MKKFNKHEQIALEKLFNLYYRPLVNFANIRLNDIQESENVVTEIFIDFWNKGKLSESHLNIKSYLTTSTYHACLKVIKKRTETTQDFSSVEMKAEDSGFDEQVKQLVIQKAYEAIETLPPACREIFQLFLKGLTNEEIAGKKNISVHTVKNQKIRALKLIRASLKSKGISDNTIYIYLMIILLQSSPAFSQN